MRDSQLVDMREEYACISLYTEFAPPTKSKRNVRNSPKRAALPHADLLVATTQSNRLMHLRQT
jgi:hypothetical protein